MNTDAMNEFKNRTVVDIRPLNKWEVKFLGLQDYEETYSAMIFDDGIALYFPIPFTDDDAVQIEYPDNIRAHVEREQWTHD